MKNKVKFELVFDQLLQLAEKFVAKGMEYSGEYTYKDFHLVEQLDEPEVRRIYPTDERNAEAERFANSFHQMLDEITTNPNVRLLIAAKLLARVSYNNMYDEDQGKNNFLAIAYLAYAMFDWCSSINPTTEDESEDEDGEEDEDVIEGEDDLENEGEDEELDEEDEDSINVENSSVVEFDDSPVIEGSVVYDPDKLREIADKFEIEIQTAKGPLPFGDADTDAEKIRIPMKYFDKIKTHMNFPTGFEGEDGVDYIVFNARYFEDFYNSLLSSEDTE